MEGSSRSYARPLGLFCTLIRRSGTVAGQLEQEQHACCWQDATHTLYWILFVFLMAVSSLNLNSGVWPIVRVAGTDVLISSPCRHFPVTYGPDAHPLDKIHFESSKQNLGWGQWRRREQVVLMVSHELYEFWFALFCSSEFLSPSRIIISEARVLFQLIAVRGFEEQSIVDLWGSSAAVGIQLFSGHWSNQRQHGSSFAFHPKPCPLFLCTTSTSELLWSALPHVKFTLIWSPSFLSSYPVLQLQHLVKKIEV
jgi:hypothetical protein